MYVCIYIYIYMYIYIYITSLYGVLNYIALNKQIGFQIKIYVRNSWLKIVD